MIDQPAAESRVVPEWLAHLAALGWRVLVVAVFAAALLYLSTVLATA